MKKYKFSRDSAWAGEDPWIICLIVGLLILAITIGASGCATSTAGLTKDQIATRATAREARNERWWAVGEGFGNILVNLGAGWVQAKALESGSGYRK